MNLSSVWTRWVAPLAAAGGCLLVLDGCLVYRAVTAPVKLVATTVVVAGEAAGAVVTHSVAAGARVAGVPARPV